MRPPPSYAAAITGPDLKPEVLQDPAQNGHRRDIGELEVEDLVDLGGARELVGGECLLVIHDEPLEPFDIGSLRVAGRTLGRKSLEFQTDHANFEIAVLMQDRHADIARTLEQQRALVHKAQGWRRAPA